MVNNTNNNNIAAWSPNLADASSKQWEADRPVAKAPRLVGSSGDNDSSHVTNPILLGRIQDTASKQMNKVDVSHYSSYVSDDNRKIDGDSHHYPTYDNSASFPMNYVQYGYPNNMMMGSVPQMIGSYPLTFMGGPNNNNPNYMGSTNYIMGSVPQSNNYMMGSVPQSNNYMMGSVPQTTNYIMGGSGGYHHQNNPAINSSYMLTNNNTPQMMGSVPQRFFPDGYQCSTLGYNRAIHYLPPLMDNSCPSYAPPDSAAAAAFAKETQNHLLSKYSSDQNLEKCYPPIDESFQGIQQRAWNNHHLPIKNLEKKVEWTPAVPSSESRSQRRTGCCNW